MLCVVISPATTACRRATEPSNILFRLWTCKTHCSHWTCFCRPCQMLYFGKILYGYAQWLGVHIWWKFCWKIWLFCFLAKSCLCNFLCHGTIGTRTVARCYVFEPSHGGQSQIARICIQLSAQCFVCNKRNRVDQCTLQDSQSVWHVNVYCVAGAPVPCWGVAACVGAGGVFFLNRASPLFLPMFPTLSKRLSKNVEPLINLVVATR